MPAIRDGRGQLTVHDMGAPPGNPSGPVERSRVSEARMADFAAERAAGAERPRKSSPAVLDNRAAAAASRARGAQRAGFVKGAANRNRIHHDAGSLRARAQVDEGKRAMSESQIPTDAASDSIPQTARRYPLPRDRAARDALVLDALRGTSSVRAAGERLGVSETRVGQIMREIRLAGAMPADLDADLKGRSARAAAKLTRDVPLVPPETGGGPEAGEASYGNIPVPESTSRPDVLLPCEDCAHIVVCAIRPQLLTFHGDLAGLAELHPGVRVAAVSIECDHHLVAS